ncbi:signal peptidase II [Microbacterium sp. Mu-80]|uniref:Lipoprotein signal peptidase n=1 Tax=Microbacterium bandirmense TaxID=3122050 RepID=A0ABU8LG64_9MICO
MTAQDAVVERNRGSAASRRRALGLALVVAVLALAVDQGSKVLAVAQLTSVGRIPLIGDLFGLSLVYNPGAAFSLGSGAAWIFTVVGILAAGTVVVFAVRLRGARWGIALGLVLGGALGNLVDRLLNPPSFGQGDVTDFLAYGNLFVGNIADVFVVIGVGVVCLNLLTPTRVGGARAEGIS